MTQQRMDLLQGTLDLLILKTLTLQRLEQQKLIASEWSVSEKNRKAKYYRLTPAGRARLARETSDWKKLSNVINLILSTT